MNSFSFGLLIPPIRWIIKFLVTKFVPPGTGPTEKQLREGYAHLTFIGKSDKTGKKVRSDIITNGEPGYFATGIMLGESALTLARDYQETNAHKLGGGVISPAAAFGPIILKRLERNGFQFSVSPM